jgi:hypothetical protein
VHDKNLEFLVSIQAAFLQDSGSTTSYLTVKFGRTLKYKQNSLFVFFREATEAFNSKRRGSGRDDPCISLNCVGRPFDL